MQKYSVRFFYHNSYAKIDFKLNQNSNSDKDDNNPKKESDLIKFFKKRSFIYLMCAVVFVVFFVPDLIQEDELEQKLTKNLDDQQKIAVDIMKSYQGVDAQGLRLFDAVMIQIENAYPNEKILMQINQNLKKIVNSVCSSEGLEND